MIESYQKFLTNYLNFKGCSSRRDYWYVVLINMIIISIIELLVAITNIEKLEYLIVIYNLAIFIPYISLTIRRLHDSNKSGWFYLLVLVPFFGTITMIIFMCLDREEPNQYGERI